MKVRGKEFIEVKKLVNFEKEEFEIFSNYINRTKGKQKVSAMIRVLIHKYLKDEGLIWDVKIVNIGN